jgi:hypothetical protein
MIRRGIPEGTKRKLSFNATLSAMNPAWTRPRLKLRLRSEKLVPNLLFCAKTLPLYFFRSHWMLSYLRLHSQVISFLQVLRQKLYISYLSMFVPHPAHLMFLEFSIQLNSLLFMCRVNSRKANYRQSTVLIQVMFSTNYKALQLFCDTFRSGPNLLHIVTCVLECTMFINIKFRETGFEVRESSVV